MAFNEEKYFADRAAYDALRNSQFYSSRMTTREFATLDVYIDKSHGHSRASRISITDEETRQCEILLYRGNRLASEADRQKRVGLMVIWSTAFTFAFFWLIVANAPISTPLFVLSCLACSMMLGFFLFCALWLGYDPVKEKVLALLRS